MKNTKELTPRQKNIVELQNICGSAGFMEKVGAIFEDKAKAGQFVASVITAVRLNSKLQECSPSAVAEQALIAASVDLNINGTLGECAIIPFKTDGKYVPQLQIMTRGITELCLRSGQYSAINVYWLYKDEYLGKNLITGEVKFQEVADGDRANDRSENIVGYGCYFRLNTGFEKNEFWTIADLEAHGKKYSQAYRYDLQNHTQTSLWSTNKPAMYSKTILKNTLNKWGVKSVAMRVAFEADQNTGTKDGKYQYGDNSDIPETPSFNEEEMAIRTDLLQILSENGFTEDKLKTYFKADFIDQISTEKLEERVQFITNAKDNPS